MAESPAASVLRGWTDGGQTMKTSSNMIRVFISSTFTGQTRWL